MSVVIASRMGIDGRARHDLGASSGVRREHAMKANQMQPRD
jgi:hypothetical protein